MFEASLVAILYIHLRRYEISHEVVEMEMEVEVEMEMEMEVEVEMEVEM